MIDASLTVRLDTLLRKIKRDTQALEQAIAVGLDDRIEAGKIFLRVRATFPARGPGAKGWGDFLRERQTTLQTASRYMKIAEHVLANPEAASQSVGHLYGELNIAPRVGEGEPLSTPSAPTVENEPAPAAPEAPRRCEITSPEPPAVKAPVAPTPFVETLFPGDEDCVEERLPSAAAPMPAPAPAVPPPALPPPALIPPTEPEAEPVPDLVVEIDLPDALGRDLESIARGVRGIKKMWPFAKKKIADALRALAAEVEA